MLSLVVLSGMTAVASLHAQSVEVERLDGSHLSIENYSEHRANVFVFLSSRSPETRRASVAIRQANEKYRRRKFMFIGVFPNPAESAGEILKFCQASGFTFPTSSFAPSPLAVSRSY